jgi:methionine-rich copper-binding protein CopC
MNKEFFKSTGARVGIWVAAIIAVALFFWLTAPKSPSNLKTTTNANVAIVPVVNANAPLVNANAPKAAVPVKKPAPKPPAGFAEKKTPHFVSATIANNATLAAVPTTLTLNFDALVLKTQQSFVTVKRNDIDSITLNASSVDAKSLFVRLNPSAANGDYYVYYVACFADTGCADGRFGYHLQIPKK